MGTSTLRAGTRPAARTRAADLPRAPVVLVLLAVATVALRLAYVAAPMSADEGGFLAVARQWRPGTSLYGDQWVDRPPLLLAFFRLATLTGGLPALRVLGALAAGVVVLGCGLAVRRVLGGQAAAWSAAVAGALLVSPLVGAVPVDGELLAAPFVAVGVWLALVALDPGPRSSLAALGSGACAAAAVLVKQNMVDVGVVVAVLGAVGLATGRLPWPHATRLAAAFATGATALSGLVLGGALLLGSRTDHVLFAMYDFRLRAARVLETVGAVGHLHHLDGLAAREVLGLGVLPLAALLVLLLHRRLPSGAVPLAVATAALAAYDVFSVLAGGSWWSHYLVQLAVPTALATGLVAAARPRLGPALGALVVTSGVVAWTVGQVVVVPDPAAGVGAALAASSEPGDTGVSLLGDADVLESAGLPSPYPYLWSLPARTLDPHLTRLARVLAGPHAPTWVVVRGPQTRALLDTHGAGRVLAERYRPAGTLCGRTVLLRDGLVRPPLRQVGSCTEELSGR